MENQIISDYACGMGQFLFLTALEFFDDAPAPQNKSKMYPKFRFLGMDNDPFAINIANFCVKLLQTAPDLNIYFQNFEFVQTDSLSPLPHTLKNPLQTKNSAKKIADLDEEIITLLLSNPPYQSWGLGRVEKLQKTKDAEYRKMFPNTAEYKISLYSLFIERGIQLLKPNGITGLILPDSFLTGKYFRKLREFLLKYTSIHEIVLFQKNFWGDADSGLPVILIFQKNAVNTKDENRQLSSMTKIRTIKADFESNKVKIISDYQVYQDTFWFAPQFRFRLFFNPEDEAFVLHFELNSKPLGDFFEVHHGIRSKTGIGKRRIVSQAHKGLFWKPSLITGNSITPYHVQYQGHFKIGRAHV